MKEKYFTQENIHHKAHEMLDKVRIYPPKNNIIFTPGNSGLLVLDMQGFFLKEHSHAFIPSAPAIIPGIKDLIESYTQKGLPVIFTRHLNTPQNSRLMARWWKDLIQEENPLSEITTDLNPTVGLVVKKSQYDAFYETPLEDILRNKGVRQLTISGVMTHLCCETTARSAFVRGLEVFFIIDGTATYTENYHLSTLINLSHGFALPVFAKDIIRAMGAIDAG